MKIITISNINVMILATNKTLRTIENEKNTEKNLEGKNLI